MPFQLAKSLAALDAASGGRVVAGLGTGWSLDEYAAAAVRPFQGNADQLAGNLAAHAAIGLDEIFLDLQGGLWDAEELKDGAAEVYATARSAGV